MEIFAGGFRPENKWVVRILFVLGLLGIGFAIYTATPGGCKS